MKYHDVKNDQLINEVLHSFREELGNEFHTLDNHREPKPEYLLAIRTQVEQKIGTDQQSTRKIESDSHEFKSDFAKKYMGQMNKSEYEYK